MLKSYIYEQGGDLSLLLCCRIFCLRSVHHRLHLDPYFLFFLSFLSFVLRQHAAALVSYQSPQLLRSFLSHLQKPLGRRGVVDYHSCARTRRRCTLLVLGRQDGHSSVTFGSCPFGGLREARGYVGRIIYCSLNHIEVTSKVTSTPGCVCGVSHHVCLIAVYIYIRFFAASFFHFGAGSSLSEQADDRRPGYFFFLSQPHISPLGVAHFSRPLGYYPFRFRHDCLPSHLSAPMNNDFEDPKLRR